jgi:signal transduction histidine kinase
VRAAGVQVRLDVAAGPVPPEVDATGYVVVQEALTNVLRHAGASVADVQVRRVGDVLEITVTDDGRSDDGRARHTEADHGEGLGIPGMRSRVQALGGSLEAGPRPDGGFEVRAVLPLTAGPAGDRPW